MGYTYGLTARGRWALACDGCGEADGRTRKRTCPRKVLADSTRSGRRCSLPYCYPPALCPDCWAAAGRTKGVHGDCAEGAAKCQAEYDETERRFQAGEGCVVSASGDWADDVPDGMVKVTFSFPSPDGPRWRPYLMPAEDYRGGGWLTEHPNAVPFDNEGS